jgi:hypothetical protein
MARRARDNRPIVTFEASQALDEAKEPFWKIEYAIDRLNEEDLISFIAETRRLAAEGSHRELFGALAEYASGQRAILEARRSEDGIWYACLDVIEWEPSQRSGRGIESYQEKCEGRSAAVLVARRLLVEHAGKLSDNITVDARVTPELEWLEDQRA